MNHKRLLSLGLSAALAATALTAMNFSIVKAAKEKAITVSLEDEPESMDPAQVRWSFTARILAHTYETLTRQGKNNETIPGIATKWTHSADSKTWTFTLRKGAKWTNGAAVTAKDYVYAWRRMVDPKTASPYASQFFYMKNGEAINQKKITDLTKLGVKAVNDYTLQVTLSQPVTFFDNMVANATFVPLNEAFVKKEGANFAKETKNMIFCGPFTVSSWKHQNSLVLKKNPNYWNAKQIKLDKITMPIIKEANTIMQKFFAKELDMAGVTGMQRPTYTAKGYKLGSYNDGATFYLEFNTKDAVLKNKNIRKALSYAIDRNSFCKNVLKNDSEPATGLVTPVLQGLKKSFRNESGDLISEKKNVKLAKSLFQKGVKELGLKKDPKIEFLAQDSDVAREQAQALQAMWKKVLGINVDIKIADTNTFNDKVLKGDFQMDFSGWGPDYAEAMSDLDIFQTGNGNNNTKYSNPKFDKLIVDAKNTGSKELRISNEIKAEKILMDDMPIAPVYFRVRNYAVNPKLKGVVRRWSSPDPDFYWAYLAN